MNMCETMSNADDGRGGGGTTERGRRGGRGEWTRSMCISRGSISVGLCSPEVHVSAVYCQCMETGKSTGWSLRSRIS